MIKYSIKRANSKELISIDFKVTAIQSAVATKQESFDVFVMAMS